MAKGRLDTLLVKSGLARDRDHAQQLIVEGRVLVNGFPSKNTACQVDGGADLSLQELAVGYVSRGAYKLERGLQAFAVDPRGMVALDVGASTGGFSDLLLRRGAAKVFAVDVGYGQLAWSLRQDPRIIVLERENIRTLDPAAIAVPIDLAVIDVSFISLTKILGKVAELMRGPGKTIIALIKPQFEARKDQVQKGGVVGLLEVRRECVDRVKEWAHRHSFRVGDVVESPIRGPAGNVEFLIELGTPPLASASAAQACPGGGPGGSPGATTGA